MRKNLIALSVAAFVGGLGMAGSATAAVITGTATATGEAVRQSGTGHQLIVPYYNTQAGNATLFNIVNSDVTNGKAVKVRFRGASNSDDVFDFQLYLSPGDVWTANISKGPNGVARLTTVDKSCTLPSSISGANGDFVTARLPQTLTGDSLATQTREGYIEVFNMADIPPGTGAAGANSALYTAIKHVNGIPPCAAGTTAAMTALAANPTTVGAANTLGLFNPTTGLFANWTIVNVPKSGSATGEAVAITATIPGVAPAGPTPGVGNIVFFPQISGGVDANMFVGATNNFTADPSFRTVGVDDGAGGVYPGLPVLTAQFFDLPDLSTPYTVTYNGTLATDPVNFVTSLQKALATSSVTNEFLTDTTINAFTDWTFSSPTRRYGVVVDYRPLSANPAAAARGVYDATNLFWRGSNTAVGGATAAGQPFQICTATGTATISGVTFRDREETAQAGSSFVISPNLPTPGFALCGEVSVLTFNSTGPSVLGAEIARTNFATLIGSTLVRDGWAVVSTPGATSVGLPVVGKSFSAAATGTFNVGGSWEHRYVPTFP